MALRSRRDVLRVLGLTGVGALVAACSQPATTPPPAPTSAPKPAGQQAPAQSTGAAAGGGANADWDKVVDAAKKEGHLQVATYAGSGNRKVMDDFEAAYPGIKVDHTSFQSSSRDFFPRY